MIGKQKWSIVLGILWLAYHNPEINWRTEEVKMMRCPEECRKQWRPKQGKPRWQKQKEEEAKEEAEKKREEKVERQKKRKLKKEKTIEVKRVAEEWEIWDEEEEVAKSEAEAKKLVLEQFHKWIKVFSKKQSERMSTWKIWDYAIDIKKGFVPRKGKVYPLSREEREKICKFISKQLRKKYIRLLKSS